MVKEKRVRISPLSHQAREVVERHTVILCFS